MFLKKQLTERFFLAVFRILFASFCVLSFSTKAFSATIINIAEVNFKLGGVPQPHKTGTVSTPILPSPTKAVVQFYRFIQGDTPPPCIFGTDGVLSSSSPRPCALLADGTMYSPSGNMSGPFSSVGSITTVSGTPINLNNSVSILPTTAYHPGEPVFMTLSDGNRNANPLVREVIEVTIKTSTGDDETLRLQETGPNTGVFAGVVQSFSLLTNSVADNDGTLSIAPKTDISVLYIDPDFPSDTAEDKALVDPFGVVFNSVTGAPVNGAIVSLVLSTGGAASVFGDDGVTPYPSQVISGDKATTTELGKPTSKVYDFADGEFRFPRIPEGDYRLVVIAPPGFSAPSTVPLAQLQSNPATSGFETRQGSKGEVFTVGAKDVHIDIPIDPTQLAVEKRINRAEATTGDFLSYQVIISNFSQTQANAVVLTDILPIGFRYQTGSARQNNVLIPNPAISTDGRTLTFSIGTLIQNAKAEIRYVTEVTSGTPVGSAVNRASARGVDTSGVPLVSNVAQVAVKVSPPFFSTHGTIIGRVVEGECNTPWENLVGLPNARLIMEDGTYITTDRDGQYHFEKVKKGTHVVQLDVDSLGAEWGVSSCIQNTRFAHGAYSQFVEIEGGMLWRADFYVHKKKPLPRIPPTLTMRYEQPIEGVVGIALQGRIEVMRKLNPSGSFSLKSNFDTNKAILKPMDIEALNALVLSLKNIQIDRMDVIGHTDIRPTHLSARSLFRDNYHLSDARANVVANYLSEALGLPLNRFVISGKGPDKPIADNKTVDGLARNRRTEIKIFTAASSKTTAVSRLFYHVDIDGRNVPVTEMRLMIALPLRFKIAEESVRIDGASTRVSHNGDFVVFNLTDMGAELSHRIDFEVTGADDNSCVQDQFVVKAVALFNTKSEVNLKTPVAVNRLPCNPKPSPSNQGKSGNAVGTIQLTQSDMSSERMETPTKEAVAIQNPVEVENVLPLQTPLQPKEDKKTSSDILDDVTASGRNTDWFLGQASGIDWLFPLPNHNPRAPTIRVVIKHLPSQKVVLSKGFNPVDILLFDGTQVNADKTVAVSIWRGLSLQEGKNWFNATILDLATGREVTSLSRVLHYANTPAHIEFMPHQSYLIADGINTPMIAVRVTDKNGWPVRSGVTGPFTIEAPFVPMQVVDEMQRRQQAGLDDFKPMWQVVGDDGIARIKLKPTTETGEVVAIFSFDNLNPSFAGREVRKEEVRGYIKPAPRDFVVVGFVEGTVGYNTLKGNMEGLGAENVADNLFTEGEGKFYAKGRIRGDWLLTLAYDSDKPASDRESLFQVIDPNAFYTLYGDGTGQRYDASSQRKLYLKLEKNQFIALFGDFETGLTKTELMRYSRALNGVRVSYQGKQVLFTAFAAETPQNFVRDEIQGAGTSGLYRLSQGGILLNAERVRIETRDRLKSEVIIETKSLTRHLDYDIDYPNGTLFFRKPIPARDTNFNPVFIVVEYEVNGGTKDALNAGGRVGVNLGEWHGATGDVGFSYIRNADRLTRANLGGMDLKLNIPGGNEARLEGAASSIREDGLGGGIASGSAYLAEVTHHGKRWDAVLYTRLQDADFGVNQQNGARGGMRKTGVTGKMALAPNVAIFGEGSREENLVLSPTRDIVSARVEVSDKEWKAFAGLQSVNDTSVNGTSFDSHQATVGANRRLLNNRLDIEGKAELSLGGKNGSLDYPSRYVLQAGWRLTGATRLIVAHEMSDGDSFNTHMTRVGLESSPWKGARLTTTLNQNINEYGPRTFGVMGLSQSLLLGKQWGADFSVDQSRTFSELPIGAPNLSPSHPIAVGGTLGSGLLTEDYVALSAGATYRRNLLSWNGRIENRNGEIDRRLGLTTALLHEARAGVAFSSSLRLFETERINGAEGLLGNLDFAVAYRPLGTAWSILDRLQFRYETLRNGIGVVGSGLFGNNSLTTISQTKSRALIHHFNLNIVSRVWENKDQEGNLFHLNQRNQGSLYYGSKYSFDQYDGADYKGYSDLLGIDLRHDFTNYLIDMGLHADMLHSWNAHNYKYAVGPTLGISPGKNAWITVGYNFKGFYDRDFEQARYTASGPYIKFRIKFDQNTKITPGGSKEEEP
jgi:uncharacterized repeat protein (TIGR01451 family)